ncbi:MAG TPA: prepilin-type N-terminal cleavage/methylation domain-containing protein [Candidatus Aquilonibacter sp.]|nr:prepilin-type N-terminal cleavage/methylation domain-containing protein [Candidatus Aquilonibacter sp.]
MKRERGFTLIEMLTAMAIMLVIGAAAVTALVQAQRVTQGVAMEAATQENLRAGMHFMVRDITQAGEGLPPGGISIPNSSSAVSALNRPATTTTFNSNYVVLSGIEPGSAIGQLAKGVTTTGTVITTGANPTDIITVLYADNSLVDSSANKYYLNQYPITQTGTSHNCAGTFTTAASVTLDSTCFDMPGSGPTPIAPGNLMMFENEYGTALEYVTGVSGQTISFASGDPAGLNAVSASSYPNGTAAALLANGSVPTTITRVWMVTYYLDSTTNPTHPQLVRQVNYPGYPTTATQTNAPQPIADDIEDLGFTFDIIDSTAPSGTYPNGAGDAPQPACWAHPCSSNSDTPQQIRAVNVYLAGRSERPYQLGNALTFFHNNLSTQVSIRSLAFTNQYNTSATAPE